MKALTYRGQTEFPIDIKIVERGKMIVGAYDKDEIISYFTIDGINYACFGGICSLTNGTIGKAMADSNLPKRTGFLDGEQINYAVYNNGEYKKVVWTNSYEKSGHTLWEGQLGEVVEIEDNPYYSIDPVWPESDYIASPYSTAPKASAMKVKLSKHFKVGEYVPKYYETYTFELVEGDGVIYPYDKVPNNVSYKFTKTDIAREYIKVKIVCTPLKNSGSKDTERILKLQW